MDEQGESFGLTSKLFFSSLGMHTLNHGLGHATRRRLSYIVTYNEIHIISFTSKSKLISLTKVITV